MHHHADNRRNRVAVPHVLNRGSLNLSDSFGIHHRSDFNRATSVPENPHHHIKIHSTWPYIGPPVHSFGLYLLVYAEIEQGSQHHVRRLCRSPAKRVHFL